MSIQKLSQNTISHIESSSTIVNLNQVVCELLKNSLDACATKIDVSVDYERGACVVEDNGEGILPSDFHDAGGLCKLFHASKKKNLSTIFHGCRGKFLAGLTSIATSLTITSHHKLFRSHNTLIFHYSLITSRLIPAPSHHHLQFSHGTKVTVHNLFEHLPVRVKQRHINSKYGGNWMEWDELVNKVVELLLPRVTDTVVVLRENATGHKLSLGLPTSIIGEKVPGLCNILCQASLITVEDAKSWITVEASNSDFKISGAISLLPSATKVCQFLSLGIKPLKKDNDFLYDEINQLFFASDFGNTRELDHLKYDGDKRLKNDISNVSFKYRVKDLKGKKKDAEFWPKFYIKIQEINASTSGKSTTQISEKYLSGILELLQLMIWRFLKLNGLYPRNLPKGKPITDGSLNSLIQKRQDKDCDSSNSFSASTIDKLNLSFDPLGVDTKLPISNQVNMKTKFLPFFSSKIKIGAATTSHLDKKIKTDEKSIAKLDSTLSLEKATISRVNPTSQKPRANGKFTRIKGISQPFEYVTIFSDSLSWSIHKNEMRQQCTLPIDDSTSERKNENNLITTWVCPTTKKELLVNQRSGLAINLTKAFSTKSNQKLSLHSIPSQFKPDHLASSWIYRILETWKNPIYFPAEKAVPRFSDHIGLSKSDVPHSRCHNCSQVEIDRVFNTSFGLNSRISKNALQTAKIIAQIDKKFILIKLRTSVNRNCENSEDILVVVDQHAADERVRIESLLKDLCSPVQSLQTASPAQIKTHLLNKPLTFQLSPQEARLFLNFKAYYSRWGIIYEVPEDLAAINKSQAPKTITVLSIPPTIARRCQAQPELLISLLKAELPRLQEWYLNNGSKLPSSDSSNWISWIHDCPTGILDLLNSRACRSAIMFNDELSLETSEFLIRQLAGCVFPFQCAHGRPSMVPLVSLNTILSSDSYRSHERYIFQNHEMKRQNRMSFGAQFQKWKDG